MSGQATLDFDAIAKAERWEAILAAGEQPGVVERVDALDAWADSHPTSPCRIDHTEMPWPMWSLGYTVPGALTSAAELAEARAEMAAAGVHVPTVLSVDCRPDRYRPELRPGRPPYKYLRRGACLGCRWEGEPRDTENEAVEDAHDHSHPWWRELPVVERPAGEKPSAKAIAAILAACEAAVPGCTADPWCPVRTWRTPPGTRHHMGGLLGGFDLGVPR